MAALPKQPVPPPFPINSYCAPGVHWPSIRRVLLLPLANETEYPHAEMEVHTAMASELQATGRFEVVVPPSDLERHLSRHLREFGTFEEVELMELARAYQLDAVLFGTITQYHPYFPPRLGLTVQLISPVESVVIAAVDGIWDARDLATAEQARAYYGQHLTPSQTLLAADLILTAPQYFQRFVCHQAALSLVARSPAAPVHGLVGTALIPGPTNPPAEASRPEPAMAARRFRTEPPGPGSRALNLPGIRLNFWGP